MKLFSPIQIQLSVFMALAACASAAAPDDSPAGWRSLFDGESLKGWEVKSGFATFRVEDGAIVGKTAEGSGNTFLCTIEHFGDFELEFDVLLDDNELNSGVQIRSLLRDGPHGGRVHGPQVEIASGPGLSGFIYGEGLGRWLSPELAAQDRSRPRHTHFKLGEWNHFRVLAVGPRIQTWINGELIAELMDEESYQTYPKGLIGLQVHGIKKNTGPFQVRWRNIKIREIEKSR
jgi:hypothetical protein